MLLFPPRLLFLPTSAQRNYSRNTTQTLFEHTVQVNLLSPAHIRQAHLHRRATLIWSLGLALLPMSLTPLWAYPCLQLRGCRKILSRHLLSSRTWLLRIYSSRGSCRIFMTKSTLVDRLLCSYYQSTYLGLGLHLLVRRNGSVSKDSCDTITVLC